MNIDQFKLALNHTEASDWAHFERLCSAFLVSEYSTLRTMANPSGDGGRDSELFASDKAPLVAFQYSVTSGWRAKIRQTATRLSEEHPNIKILIYMSNHQIGGAADDLRAELLEAGFMLDIRDQNWFLERTHTDAVRENAAKELFDRIGKPYLEDESLIQKSSSALNNNEARAALLYLGLQWKNDNTDKGLTKISFDALVRAALRHTNSEILMKRQQIKEKIASALSSADRSILDKEVDKALTRLTKRFIRSWPTEDAFCLTHEEHLRIMQRLAETEDEKAVFLACIEKLCAESLADINGSKPEDTEDLINRIPRVLESLLLKRGEYFAIAVKNHNLDDIGFDDLTDIIMNDLSNNRPASDIAHYFPALISLAIKTLLEEADETIERYLRGISNSYTLLTFLNQTPDIQAATRKIFSHGTIWIDTTVLLPLFTEQLKEESQRHFTKVFTACSKAGVKLMVTTGILQEVNAHMNNALQCSRFSAGSWRGRTPYLYFQYLRTGMAPADFGKWLSLFRGRERPVDDLALFLKDLIGMEIYDLEKASQKIPEDFRWAVDRLWSEAHSKRRGNNLQSDETTTRKLIQHDVETYLGVVALRKDEPTSELGYRHWLLTLDRNAWEIRTLIREEFQDETPSSPLLSLPFLLSSIAFGPLRQRVGKESELSLPVILDIELSDPVSLDIIGIADKVRREHEGAPEYVIRRMVRDAIDAARRRSRIYAQEADEE